MEEFRRDQESGIEWLESPVLAGIPWLVHGFGTRVDREAGSRNRDFNLGLPEGAEAGAVLTNRKRFMRALGAADFELAAIRQIHSDAIFTVTVAKEGGLAYAPLGCPQANGAGGDCQGDALITRQAGILLSIRTADCMPILLVDVKKRVVAAAHAGWRGALNRIVEKTGREMRRAFGSHSQDVLAVVGPSIGACCYQVGNEVVEAFRGEFENASDFIVCPGTLTDDPLPPRSSGFSSRLPHSHGPGPQLAFRLNLAAVARYQLEAAGIRPQNIAISAECTSCHNERFFSYRKEGSRAGRMMAVIGVRLG